MISKITDKIMDTAIAYQNRSLDPVYPIVYMDAIKAVFVNVSIQSFIIYHIRREHE